MRWEQVDYQQISSALLKGSVLEVLFADGTQTSLDVTKLIPVGATLNGEVHHNLYEVVISTSIGPKEIPWNSIRLLTDEAFSSFWAEQEENRAKKIGTRLKDLRTRRGLTGKQVAERVGIMPQSLSRIESGRHDVSFVTLRKLLAAMGYSLSDLAESDLTPKSLGTIVKRLESVGAKGDWLRRRILPKLPMGISVSDMVAQTVHLVSRVFGWSTEDILSDMPLNVDRAIANSARFKISGNTSTSAISLYSIYAQFVARLTAEAASQLPAKKVPNDPKEIRSTIIMEYGEISLESVLNYVWSLGIPVIPLNDEGAFHGACWRINDRYVIVLKQMTDYQARWLYDLIHELGHISKGHLDNEMDGLVEPREISPFQNSKEEKEANDFASQVLFSGKAEDLAEHSVSMAHGRLEMLKSAVIKVSTSEHVPIDLLANYMAHRLSLQGENWWGTANNLQVIDPPPFNLTKSTLLKEVNLDLLGNEDKDLIVRMLSDVNNE